MAWYGSVGMVEVMEISRRNSILKQGEVREISSNPPLGAATRVKGRFAHGHVCAGKTGAGRGRLAPRAGYVWLWWPGAAVAAPADTGLTASSIVVQGNRRVDADTVRSYFKVAPGEHLDAAKIDAGAQGALRHRPVPGRPHLPIRRQADRHGGGGAGHQPACLRRQSPDEGRAAPGGNSVEGARRAVARDGAGGYPAHHRDLPAQRPLRRLRSCRRSSSGRTTASI